jgi:hypothetical protein
MELYSREILITVLKFLGCKKEQLGLLWDAVMENFVEIYSKN